MAERFCIHLTVLLSASRLYPAAVWKTFNAQTLIRLMLDSSQRHLTFNTAEVARTHTHTFYNAAVIVTHETLDHVWDTLRTCDCMRVRAGMRSRVAQAGRQADITNRAQRMMMMMTTTWTRRAALTLLVAANAVSTTDPDAQSVKSTFVS